jgi:hypothetical protein
VPNRIDGRRNTRRLFQAKEITTTTPFTPMIASVMRLQAEPSSVRRFSLIGSPARPSTTMGVDKDESDVLVEKGRRFRALHCYGSSTIERHNACAGRLVGAETVDGRPLRAVGTVVPKTFDIRIRSESRNRCGWPVLGCDVLRFRRQVTVPIKLRSRVPPSLRIFERYCSAPEVGPCEEGGAGECRPAEPGGVGERRQAEPGGVGERRPVESGSAAEDCVT